jgi:hypothetical protein
MNARAVMMNGGGGKMLHVIPDTRLLVDPE